MLFFLLKVWFPLKQKELDCFFLIEEPELVCAISRKKYKSHSQLFFSRNTFLGSILTRFLNVKASTYYASGGNKSCFFKIAWNLCQKMRLVERFRNPYLELKKVLCVQRFECLKWKLEFWSQCCILLFCI